MWGATTRCAFVKLWEQVYLLNPGKKIASLGDSALEPLRPHDEEEGSVTPSSNQQLL
jgi:hypothetical protein